MKTFQRYVLFALALLLTFNLNAQKKKVTETKKGTYIIIQKNNGDEKVIQDFDDLDNILLDFKVGDIESTQTNDFMQYHSPRSTKPYLGVYTSKNENGNGIVIDKTVKNSAAEKAGLQKGDIISAINGNSINSVSDLRAQLRKHKIGDPIDVSIIRNGNASQVEATLGRKQTHRSYGYAYHRSPIERDPCKVFIGVYSGTSYNSKGVRVTGVIPNTPAYEVDLLKGDYITAIDGIKVHSHRELLTERNKHNAGDKFLISYTRDGIAYEVMAQFKDCPKDQVKEVVDNVITEEVEEIPEVQQPIITQPSNNNSLQLEGLEAYPNPTYGDLNLNFTAEAKPINIRIVDVTGRVLFGETLNNFDGIYKRELDLSDGTPGILAITITQEGKVFTKNIILLARA